MNQRGIGKAKEAYLRPDLRDDKVALARQRLQKCSGSFALHDDYDYIVVVVTAQFVVFMKGCCIYFCAGEGKEIIIYGCNGIGPYVQFGNNNTMNITTPARHLPCPGSSSSRGRPGSSTQPKGSTKKEKITGE